MNGAANDSHPNTNSATQQEHGQGHEQEHPALASFYAAQSQYKRHRGALQSGLDAVVDAAKQHDRSALKDRITRYYCLATIDSLEKLSALNTAQLGLLQSGSLSAEEAAMHRRDLAERVSVTMKVALLLQQAVNGEQQILQRTALASSQALAYLGQP